MTKQVWQNFEHKSAFGSRNINITFCDELGYLRAERNGQKTRLIAIMELFESFCLIGSFGWL